MYDESAKNPRTIKKRATVNPRQTERVNEAFLTPGSGIPDGRKNQDQG
jgi:hypothetical protein